jgi:hypothetical protein
MGHYRDSLCTTLVDYAWASAANLSVSGLGLSPADRLRAAKAYLSLVNILLGCKSKFLFDWGW